MAGWNAAIVSNICKYLSNEEEWLLGRIVSDISGEVHSSSHLEAERGITLGNLALKSLEISCQFLA